MPPHCMRLKAGLRQVHDGARHQSANSPAKPSVELDDCGGDGRQRIGEESRCNNESEQGQAREREEGTTATYPPEVAGSGRDAGWI